MQSLVEKEIKNLGLVIESQNRGGIFFRGNDKKVAEFAARTRFSSRITLQLAHFEVESYESLYTEAGKIPWENYINNSQSFRIDALTKDNLPNSRFATHKLKDAILDRFRQRKIPLPDIEKRTADITILVRSHTDSASIELSLSGESLSRRGYRQEGGLAPVKETIAQALLDYSGEANPFVLDPFCGSGTILIEAALLKKYQGQINRFVLEDSPIFQILFPEYQWLSSVQAPETKTLFGRDNDQSQIDFAIQNAKRAQVEEWIDFQREDFLKIKNVWGENGSIVTNPPYSDRTGYSMEELRELYFQAGKKLKNDFSGWNFTLLCGELSLLGKLALKAKTTLSLKLSNLKAKIAHYEIQRSTHPSI